MQSLETHHLLVKPVKLLGDHAFEIGKELLKSHSEKLIVTRMYVELWFKN